MDTRVPPKVHPKRRTFISGSDAKVIMGRDQTRLVRLWREKHGQALPQNLSKEQIVQLRIVTEDLNRNWYERLSGHTVQDVRRMVRHPILKWMRAEVGGRVRETGAVFHASVLPSGHFSEPHAANAHMAQLQHSMWVMSARSALLSIITGDGKLIEMTVLSDPLYQHLLLTAEKKFLRCVERGEPPVLFGIEVPRPNLDSIRVTDVFNTDQWANLAASHL